MRTRKSSQELPLIRRAAAVVPASLDDDARTVDVTWTTGSRVLRGFWERYWEELSLENGHVRMDRMHSGAPLLDSHRSDDTSAVIGVVESARLGKGEGVATVRFAREDPVADPIFKKIKDGILRNISVGYAIHRLEKIDEGADKIPVYRATDWEPMEISVVPIGADAGATVRAEGQRTFTCEIIVETDMEENELGVAGAPAHRAQPPAQPQPPVQPPDVGAERAAAVSQERERVAVIRRTASALGIGDEVVGKHIDAGTGADEFRALAIEEHARSTPQVASPGARPSITAGDDARDKYRAAATSWLIQRSGQSHLIGDREREQLDPGDCRGMSLLDLARDCVERAGGKSRGMPRDQVFAIALAQRGLMGAAATGDFPVILENTLNKLLLGAYATAPDTWRRFCAVGSVSDFRAHNRYRLGTFAAITTVPEGTEYENQSIPDARKESITAATKGSIIAITRQALINDDMGAFSSLATRFGRAAGLAVEQDVYALLALNSGLGPDMADGDTLFHANHDNITTGAALTAAAIDLDRVAMASQTDESGNDYLDLRPTALVVPIGLGSTARTINDAQYDPDADGRLAPNTVRGLFREIVDTPRITGTRRYLFADPSTAPTIEVAFLDGQQQPYMEMEEGFRVDGVQWKVRLDYAVGAIDYRGAVTNAGAA